MFLYVSENIRLFPSFDGRIEGKFQFYVVNYNPAVRRQRKNVLQDMSSHFLF